ncbi:MAG: hypothetical protein V4488_13685 [Pseudomonadota bacterium]
MMSHALRSIPTCPTAINSAYKDSNEVLESLLRKVQTSLKYAGAAVVRQPLVHDPRLDASSLALLQRSTQAHPFDNRLLEFGRISGFDLFIFCHPKITPALLHLQGTKSPGRFTQQATIPSYQGRKSAGAANESDVNSWDFIYSKISIIKT